MNVGIVGGHRCSRNIAAIAEELGYLIARQGWVLICGGGGGVMEAACRGVREAGGLSIGILPSSHGQEANAYLDIKIPTGLGYARNFLVVRASHVIIAVDGEYGTLSEIAFALCEGKRVLGIKTWKIKGVKEVKDPSLAIKEIKRMRIK